MQARRLTANQEMYQKELKRLKARMRSAEKMGADFSETMEALLSMPSRVTKASIERLSSIRGKALWEYSSTTKESKTDEGYEDTFSVNGKQYRDAVDYAITAPISDLSYSSFMDIYEMSKDTPYWQDYSSILMERKALLEKQEYEKWLTDVQSIEMPDFTDEIVPSISKRVTDAYGANLGTGFDIVMKEAEKLVGSGKLYEILTKQKFAGFNSILEGLDYQSGNPYQNLKRYLTGVINKLESIVGHTPDIDFIRSTVNAYENADYFEDMVE